MMNNETQHYDSKAYKTERTIKAFPCLHCGALPQYEYKDGKHRYECATMNPMCFIVWGEGETREDALKDWDRLNSPYKNGNPETHGKYLCLVLVMGAKAMYYDVELIQWTGKKWRSREGVMVVGYRAAPAVPHHIEGPVNPYDPNCLPYKKGQE